MTEVVKKNKLDELSPATLGSAARAAMSKADKFKDLAWQAAAQKNKTLDQSLTLLSNEYKRQADKFNLAYKNAANMEILKKLGVSPAALRKAGVEAPPKLPDGKYPFIKDGPDKGLRWGDTNPVTGKPAMGQVDTNYKP